MPNVLKRWKQSNISCSTALLARTRGHRCYRRDADGGKSGKGRSERILGATKRDEQWCLLTGGMMRSIGKEKMRRRVAAEILVSIAQWTVERKETLAQAERVRRA